MTIRGAKAGQTYLVQTVKNGWLVTPETEASQPKHRRKWAGSKRDLTEHLDALAANGLTLVEETKPKAGPCRF